MTPDLTMAIPEPVPTAANPFALGWRHRDGGTTVLPLTQADLLWQEEGDQIVTNHGHALDMDYLAHVLRSRTEGKPGVRVFSDHCIDFQVEGVGILGPDVILLNGEDREWDVGRGTFPVKDMGARPLYAFEITSPGTRTRNFNDRPGQYYRAGVPVYVIVDTPAGGGRRPAGVVAHQAGPDGYERLPTAPDGRFWVEVAEVWVGVENGRLAAWDAAGEPIPDSVGLFHQVATLGQQNAALTEQAAAEKARAVVAEQQAAAERQRAETAESARTAAEQRMKDLEAELARLRGNPPITPNT